MASWLLLGCRIKPRPYAWAGLCLCKEHVRSAKPVELISTAPAAVRHGPVNQLLSSLPAMVRYLHLCRGAGTDANVYLEMYGDKGSLGERRLDDSKVRMCNGCGCVTGQGSGKGGSE